MFDHERNERLIQFYRGEKPGPISIHIDLTNRCNQRCLFCWQRSHERMGLLDLENELSDEQLLDFVSEAAEMGVMDWLISGGGEPTVRTDLCRQVMEKIKACGMFGDIITNGTLLDEDWARRLVEIGWDRFRVSLNGSEPSLHDGLVGRPGAFEDAVRNIRLIKHYKEKLGTDKPDIGFNTVINSRAFRKFPDIIRLLHDLGGVIINTQTIILYDDKEKPYSLNDEEQQEFKTYAKEMLGLAKKWNIHTNLDAYLHDEHMMSTSNLLGQMDKVLETESTGFANAHCYEPWYLFTLRANGIVGSCRLFGDEGTPLHGRTMAEVWHGEYFERSRQRIMENDMPDFCRHCNANEVFENNLIREGLKKHIEAGTDGRDR